MDWDVVLSGACFIALASFLRGLTGFGFAIVATPLLALVLPPSIAVPIVTILQIPSGLQTGVRDWSDTDFRAAGTAWLAGVPALIPGLYVVASVPPDLMRLIVGVVVIISTVVLSVGARIDRPPRTVELLSAGALSGFLQGAVAMAGPPIIVLLLASSWTAARCRATLSFVFLSLGSASLAIGLWRGVVTHESIIISALCIPGLIAGQVLGSHLFVRLDAKKYRTISILCVAATGVLVTIKGLASYF